MSFFSFCLNNLPKGNSTVLKSTWISTSQSVFLFISTSLPFWCWMHKVIWFLYVLGELTFLIQYGLWLFLHFFLKSFYNRVREFSPEGERRKVKSHLLEVMGTLQSLIFHSPLRILCRHANERGMIFMSPSLGLKPHNQTFRTQLP